MNNPLLKKIYELLTSRKFLSSISAVILLAFQFEITEEIQVALAVAVGGFYTIAVGVQQGLDAFNNMSEPLGRKLYQLAISRKFWVFIASGATILFGVELDPAWEASIIALITGLYNLGTSIETGLTARA